MSLPHHSTKSSPTLPKAKSMSDGRTQSRTKPAVHVDELFNFEHFSRRDPRSPSSPISVSCALRASRCLISRSGSCARLPFTLGSAPNGAWSAYGTREVQMFFRYGRCYRNATAFSFICPSTKISPSVNEFVLSCTSLLLKSSFAVEDLRTC